MRSSLLELGRRRRLSARAVAIGLSLVVHLLVLGALVLGARRGFATEPTPVADVELIRAWPDTARQKRETPKPRSSANPTREPAHLFQPPSAIEALRPVEAKPQPARFAPVIAPFSPPRLDMGCAHADFMRLTSEERAACHDRFAGKAPADADYAAIDPKARAAFDAGAEREKILQTPFLSAMPKKGCRPRVTEHDAAAFGKSQPDVTVEATCVVRF